MKREEIDRLPDAISEEMLLHIIRALGFEPNDVMEVRILPRSVTVEVLASDADGKRFLKDDQNVATYSVTYQVIR